MIKVQIRWLVVISNTVAIFANSCLKILFWILLIDLMKYLSKSLYVWCVYLYLSVFENLMKIQDFCIEWWWNFRYFCLSSSLSFLSLLIRRTASDHTGDKWIRVSRVVGNLSNCEWWQTHVLCLGVAW